MQRVAVEQGCPANVVSHGPDETVETITTIAGHLLAGWVFIEYRLEDEVETTMDLYTRCGKIYEATYKNRPVAPGVPLHKDGSYMSCQSFG